LDSTRYRVTIEGVPPDGGAARHSTRRSTAHRLWPPRDGGDDRRGIGGNADHRRAARRGFSAAIPWQGRRRHGSPVARKDHGGDLRRRGLRRAPVRDDARGARRVGAGRRLHEPRQPRARPRKYTAARARRAARPRRIEVAARARTVSRGGDAGGRRGIRVLRHVRAVARRDGHRVHPRHAFRRPYHAVVSSRAERAGADDRGLVVPHRARRLRPRAGDSADAPARSSPLLAPVLFGPEPAIQLTRPLDVRGALAGGSAAGPQRGRRQRLLLRWQVAIAAGVFIIATLFVKYSIAEAGRDSGIDLDRIGVAVLNFDTPEWNEPRARRIFDRVLDELQRHPSVEAASLSSGLPFGVPSTLRLSISPLEQTSAARMDPQVVTTIAGAPSMFRRRGGEILRGRGFDDRDGPAAPRVVVLSEFTARQMFGTADVVGREMAVGQTR